MPEFIVNKVRVYSYGLSLSKHPESDNVVYEHVVKRRTGIDVRKSDVKQYKFRISFDPFGFEKSKIVYFNGKKSNEWGYSEVSTNNNRMSRTVDFICTKYLKRLLGRMPQHGEAIYYSLEPVA